MPSASAKLEKQSSADVYDPVKQINTIVEKKVRNLEKRKAKLDTYRADSQNGRELNDDQKNAVKKYDQVIEVLDFAKELQKLFAGVFQESARQQKKIAKREQIERQQQELLRIKELLIIQDILNSMDGEDVRKDFLNGSDGAAKLSDAELNSIDELFKLTSPERSESNSSEFEQLLCSAAEHLQAILDSKPKEICGTTYKSLRETLTKIHCCGYFNKSSSSDVDDAVDSNIAVECASLMNEHAGSAGDDYLAQGEFVLSTGTTEIPSQSQLHDENSVLRPQSGTVSSQVDRPYYQAENTPIYSEPNHPIQDVLSVQSNLNFLQESQIEIEPSQINTPAVVTHSIPPPGMGYQSVGVQFQVIQSTVSSTLPSQHHQERPNKENDVPGHMTPTRLVSNTVAQSSGQLTNIGSNNLSVSQAMQVQNQTNPPPDFDPARPIPTQTYTNQNFAAAVHPIMAGAVPPNYATGIVHAVIPPRHIVSSSMVSQRTTGASVVASDHSALSMSVHNQPGLSVASGLSQTNLNAQDTKEHFSNRDYQMNQLAVDRENTQAVQSNLTTSTPQFDHADVEEHFTEEIAANYNNRNPRGSTRDSRSRSTSNPYSRGAAQGGCGNDRGYQNSNNNSQVFSGRENFADNSSYSSNLKRGLNSRGLPRGNVTQRAGNTTRGNRTGYRNQ